MTTFRVNSAKVAAFAANYVKVVAVIPVVPKEKCSVKTPLSAICNLFAEIILRTNTFKRATRKHKYDQIAQ